MREAQKNALFSHCHLLFKLVTIWNNARYLHAKVQLIRKYEGSRSDKNGLSDFDYNSLQFSIFAMNIAAKTLLFRNKDVSLQHALSIFTQYTE